MGIMISYGNEQMTGLSLLMGNNSNKMRNSIGGSLSSSNTSSLSTFSYDTSILETRPMMSIPGIYMEETTDDILDKLEQAGRVPSKEKFRRMACNVSNSLPHIKQKHKFFHSVYRLLFTLEHALTMIAAYFYMTIASKQRAQKCALRVKLKSIARSRIPFIGLIWW